MNTILNEYKRIPWTERIAWSASHKAAVFAAIVGRPPSRLIVPAIVDPVAAAEIALRQAGHPLRRREAEDRWVHQEQRRRDADAQAR